MTLITTDTKLADIVINNDPLIITVLNRFDIMLGVGDHTVKSMCETKGLDPNFITVILNTFIHEDYFPEKIMSSFSVSTIVNYLNKTNAYYEHFHLPNIERHFNFLLSKGTDNGNLAIMHKFFAQVAKELTERIRTDRNQWFPEVLAMQQNGAVMTNIVINDSDSNIDTIEDKLSDLISMFVIHLSGDYDTNLGYAVFSAIVSLKKDITRNNRIRNRLLKPLSIALKR